MIPKAIGNFSISLFIFIVIDISIMIPQSPKASTKKFSIGIVPLYIKKEPFCDKLYFLTLVESLLHVLCA